MKVALVGSWREHDAREWRLRDRPAFTEACRTLAAEIARRGHTIIVGGQGEHTADYHAVEGVVQALGAAGADAARIHILRPDDGHRTFEAHRRAFPDLFTSSSSPGDAWEVTKLYQVKTADAVVVMGGADKSMQAGVAAAISGKRVAPVGSFGGAGERLARLFQGEAGGWGRHVPPDDELGALQNPWSDPLAGRVLRMLGIERYPELLVIHGHSPDRLKLKDFLRDVLRLPDPVIMGEQPPSGLTLPEKFEQLAGRVHGAIAVVTPDDVGGLAAGPTELQGRARENVWLEVGWFWGRLGRDRFRLLVRSGTSVPSDLRGLEFSEYRDDPLERSEDVRAFVGSLGGTG